MRRPTHLAWLRTLPCCNCGSDLSTMHREAHHLIAGRYSQRKRPDTEAVPLCSVCHRDLHADGDETRWAATAGVNLEWLAGYLAGCSGDYDEGIRGIAMARK